MRFVVPVVVAAVIALALTSCTTAAAKPVAAGCARPGSASDSISVSGKFGFKPRVVVGAPVAKAKTTERTVVTVGSGTIAKPGTLVHVDYSMFNGTSGKELTTTGFEGRTIPFTLDPTRFLPGLVSTLTCSRVGSRVVGVIPPADAYGSAGSSALGVGPKDEIVFVADVVKVDPAPRAALTGPSGTAQPQAAGFPKVTENAKGVPRVHVPRDAQPSTYREEVLVAGKGATIATDSNVIVNIQIVLWRTGKVVTGNDSWAAGKTAVYNTGQYFPAFKKAIEGKRVGSRVLFVATPDLLYGAKGNETAGIRGTDDLVFLVDILGIS